MIIPSIKITNTHPHCTNRFIKTGAQTTHCFQQHLIGGDLPLVNSAQRRSIHFNQTPNKNKTMNFTRNPQ